MKETFLSGKKKYFFVLLYLSDVFAFILSACFISWLANIQVTDSFYIRFYLFLLLILIVTFSNYGLYRDKRNLFDDTDFMHILYSSFITFFIILIFIIMFDPQDIFLIFITILVLIVSIILMTIGRIILNRIVYFFREIGFDVKKTIFFGDKDAELISKLEDKHLGYNLIKVTNNIATLKKYLQKVDVVFVNTKSIDDDMLALMTKNDHIKWKIISSILNLVIDPVAFDEFKDYPIINVSNKASTKSYLFLKRIMDILLSGTAIIILSPLLLLVAILIKITMPGPVFFKQERLGKNLKPFMLYKFRTMQVNTDKNKAQLKNEVKGLFKMKNDPRITKFGKILRRTCIDELAQLFNIFLGDMSIVGPRPHLQAELPNFEGWRMARFSVKPGLTGLWQVNGRHELNFDKAILYDIYYVKHMSFFMDIMIILKTIPSIIMSKGKF